MVKDNSQLVKTIDASGIVSGMAIQNKSHLVTSTITMPKDINKITISGESYQIKDAVARIQIDEIVKKIEKMFKQPKMKSISCIHCRAPLEMRFDDHIVKCDYCHSTYVIDTDMIRDVRCE